MHSLPESKEGQLKSAHARYAAYAAERCGFSFRSLDGADGYLFEVSDGRRRAVFAAGAGTPFALNDARAAAIARDKAFCAEALRQAGLPVVPGEMFFVTPRRAKMRSPGRELEDANAHVQRAAMPVFCKPVAASNGLYAELIESPVAFTDYLQRVSREHFAILVQPYIRAPEHRVFVLEGRALFSYQKSLPQVRGDGRSTLSELVHALESDVFAPPRPALGRDDSGARVSADAVPPAGAVITLEGPANRSAGGGAHAVRDGAPALLAQLALAAAEAVHLRLAAVDIFDRGDDGLAVIEVNANPMIATLEDSGQWDLIAEIWRANLAAALR